MRLIDVVTMLNLETSFDEEKNVPRTTKVLKEFFGPDLAEKEYAILSHCWGVEKEGEQEVLFEDMKQLLTVSDEERKEIRGRTGYMKIVDTCRRARKDGLEWVWVDTCCINKESSSELSEAINSMYKWYANAELCYAYLHDTLRDSWIKGIKSMATPKWFSRGWTLQELIAPKVVHFLDRKWERIGDKAGLAWTLSRITPIPEKVLKEGLQKALSSVNDYDRPSVAQIFSWAAHRTTTREEDRAYSLLGLLGVHMPMLYGEGKNAFRRLQLEIIRTSNDQSIFAWGHQREFGWSSSILADDPSCFEDCGGVAALRPESFTARLREMGMPDEKLAGKSTQKRIRTFTVTNDGIQIWLPTATFGSYAQVTLACYRKSDPDYPLITLITIHLVFPGSTFYRVFGLRKYPGKMEFEQHLLPYKEAEYPSTFTFELHDQTLSHDGFVVNRVFPDHVVTDGSVTLSSNEDVAAIDYVRTKDNTRFLVVLSYCGGRHSVSAVLNFAHDMAHLRSRAFARLSNSNHEPTHGHSHLMQHIHFRRSIEGVRVVHGVPCDSSVHCTVRIDIVKCFGCCTHEQRLETIPFSLIGSGLRPGDYGRVPQGRHKFEPEGNIIEFVTCLGLGPFEDDHGIRLPELGSVKPWVSSLLSVPGHGSSHHLGLYEGTGWTLQANQQVVSLLEAFSFRLPGRLLAATVIRYSDPHDLRPRLYSTFAPTHRVDLDAWEPLQPFTPLCLVTMPRTWHHIDMDREFMTMLLKIIDNFSVLVGWVDKDDPKYLSEPVTVVTAIEFFVDIFCGGDILNFIGEVVFFSELPRIMETENYTEIDAGMDKGHYPTQDISGSREVTVIPHAHRVNALVAFLEETDVKTFDLQLSPEFDVRDGSNCTGGMTLWKNGSEWRSTPFATQVLRLIADAHIASEWYEDTESFLSQDADIDRHEFLSEVEQIKKWREMLIATNDEHERRTLVEDTAGKILLACWREVKSEIVQVLREVVDRYITDEVAEDDGVHENEAMKEDERIHRSARLWKIGSVFRLAIHCIPSDNPNPLQRCVFSCVIMAQLQTAFSRISIIDDAMDGISKHQLLLSERAALSSPSNEAGHALRRNVLVSDPRRCGVYTG